VSWPGISSAERERMARMRRPPGQIRHEMPWAESTA
jgi:hypothetical protein